MPYHESDHDGRNTVPTEFTKLGEVMASTLWLQRQLLLLERIQPCKRTEYLRSELKVALDRSPSQVASDEAWKSSQAKEIERLKSELYEAQGEIRELRDLASSPKLPLIKGTLGSGLVKKVLIAIVIVIVIIVIKHFLPNS